MADPFSVATGAVGVVSVSLQLLAGCIKGFVLLSSAHNVGRDASTIICMLELQEVQLMEWARRAGLLGEDGSLDHRMNARAVEEALLQIQNLLLDTEQLKKRYGLKLVPQSTSDHQPQTENEPPSLQETQRMFTSISDSTRRRVLTRASLAQEKGIFKRLWWAAVDKEKIQNLVRDIHFFVRELWDLLNPWHHDDLVNSITSIGSNIITLNNRFDQLTALNDALVALQGSSTALPNANLRILASAAEVKALRVGLGEDDGQSQDQLSSVPKRQVLLQRLQRLSESKLVDFKPLKKHETMGLAKYDGNKVFVEIKDINPSLRNKILPRVENLAALLNMRKDATFRSLSCKGIIEHNGKVNFVFEHPCPDHVTEPRSLLELFSGKEGIDPPSLTDRIRLALQIAETVQNFHRTGWLHKSLRSENIVFFPRNGSPEKAILSDPVLAGFNFARFGASTEISEQPSADPKHDIYRHPDAMGEPSRSFTALMDVYALGTILLEIAEWRALRYLVDSVVDPKAQDVPLTTLAEVQPFLLSGRGKGGTSKLLTKMGDIYASACLMCLSGKAGTDRFGAQDDLGTESSLLDLVVQRLNSCRV